MSTTEHTHIPPDRLEEAVRGRLSPADMEEVRSHCATCDRCRNAYDEELRIAAGTRAWARDAMKQRLAAHAADVPRHGIPWPRVLAIAALVVVVVGVGIIYKWSQPGEVHPPVFTDNVQQQETNLAPEIHQAPATATARQEISGDIADDPRTGTTREKKDVAASPRTDPPSLSKTPPLAEEPAPAPSAPAAHADAGDVMQTAVRSDDLIIWGTAVRAERTVQKRVEAMREGEMVQDKAKAGSMAAVRSNTFIVGQRVQDPEGRGQSNGLPGATPAELTRSGDTVYVTLVLKTLMAPAEIRSAIVRECPPDSFQILFPNGTKIGYRTPSGYLR